MFLFLANANKKQRCSKPIAHHVWMLLCQLIYKGSDHAALATPGGHEVNHNRLVTYSHRLPGTSMGTGAMTAGDANRYRGHQ